MSKPLHTTPYKESPLTYYIQNGLWVNEIFQFPVTAQLREVENFSRRIYAAESFFPPEYGTRRVNSPANTDDFSCASEIFWADFAIFRPGGIYRKFVNFEG